MKLEATLIALLTRYNKGMKKKRKAEKEQPIEQQT